MTPDMVAALERQSSVEPGDGFTWYHWRLVGEGLVVKLSVVEGYGYTSASDFGVHARQPFGLIGEVTEPSFETKACEVVGAGWCAVDLSRADRLVEQWEATRPDYDRRDAPIWAALEALAAEVQW